MSYSLTVRTRGGTHEIVNASGDIPDGEHTVSGHEDAGRVDLAVTRKRPDGAQVASAMHSHTREAHRHA